MRRFDLLGICTKVADLVDPLLEQSALTVDDFLTGGSFVFVCSGGT